RRSAGRGEERAALWGGAVLGSGSRPRRPPARLPAARVWRRRGRGRARGGAGTGAPGWRGGRTGAGLDSEAGGLVPLLGLQIVRDPEAHAGGVVHLARSLLRVLQLREAVLDLGQLVLDLPVELFHLLLSYLQCVLVEFPLLLGKA